MFLLALAGCGGAMTEDASPPDAEASAAHPVLRTLTGDATAIADDWRASEAGATFDVVTDGAPAKPWISSEHFAGNASLGFRVPSDLSGHKQRVEYKLLKASDADGLHFDNARYSAFAFKLAADNAPFLGTTIFWQAWQGFPYGPPVSLKFGAGDKPPYRIRLAIRNASTGPDSAIPDVELWSASLIAPDTWYAVIAYVKPRLDGSGAVKLWIDGTKYVDWTGSIGYDPASVSGAYDGLDLKFGIYQPGANNGRTLYIDQIAATTTFAAATTDLQP
jgi:hypothetical protein